MFLQTRDDQHVYCVSKHPLIHTHLTTSPPPGIGLSRFCPMGARLTWTLLWTLCILWHHSTSWKHRQEVSKNTSYHRSRKAKVRGKLFHLIKSSSIQFNLGYKALDAAGLHRGDLSAREWTFSSHESLLIICLASVPVASQNLSHTSRLLAWLPTAGTGPQPLMRWESWPWLFSPTTQDVAEHSIP